MIGRILLFTLGAAMLLWGMVMPVVTLFGDETSAEITSVRRQLGDRGEAIPNRYAYAISYTFKLPGGTPVVGHTQRIGDYFSPKSLGKASDVRVRYLPNFPWLNTIDRGWGFAFEYLVIAVIGALLMYLATRKGSVKPRKQTRKPRMRSK